MKTEPVADGPATRRAARAGERRRQHRRKRTGVAVVLLGSLGVGTVVAAGPALARPLSSVVAAHKHQNVHRATLHGRWSTARATEQADRRSTATPTATASHTVSAPRVTASSTPTPSVRWTGSSEAPKWSDSAQPSTSTSSGSAQTSSESAQTSSGSTQSPTLPVPAATGSAGSSSTAYGLYGKPFDLDPRPLSSSAYQQIASASASDQQQLAKITGTPRASWFGNSSDVGDRVRNRVTAAASRNAIATVVMYNIPRRDCGAYSSGGATSATAYKDWVDRFVAGLSGQQAIVIVEPDALALMSCLSSDEKATREALIKYAVKKVAAAGSWVYVDGGHSKYQTVDVIADRLRLAGVADATGFALNVSNFRPTPELLTYGDAVSAKVGGKHYVVDTGRNGMTPEKQEWCNPMPRGLGYKPTTKTGSSLADAYLWVKPPGTSDGPCNGGPSPGAWFQSYALMLAKNATY